MAVYMIENDGFRFQELDLHINDFIESFPDDMDAIYIHDFSKYNLAMAEYWPSMKTGFTQIKGNENLVPDITCWIGATLLLSPRSYRLLGDLLSPFGEFLPIYIGDEKYFIFNCLTVADVINPGAGYDEYIFDSDGLKNKVAFKPPKEFGMDVCCTDRLKEAIEGFGLQGIIFSKILDAEKS